MKKIIITAVFITALVGAFFFIFTPGEVTRDDIIKDLEKQNTAFSKVGDYFVSHDEVEASYIYTQDAQKYDEVKNEIKKTLDEDFLYLQISSDHREVIFGTASQEDPSNHKLIYSPYDKPKSVSNAETTQYSGWYIKM